MSTSPMVNGDEKINANLKVPQNGIFEANPISKRDYISGSLRSYHILHNIYIIIYIERYIYQHVLEPSWTFASPSFEFSAHLRSCWPGAGGLKQIFRKSQPGSPTGECHGYPVQWCSRVVQSCADLEQDKNHRCKESCWPLHLFFQNHPLMLLNS